MKALFAILAMVLSLSIALGISIINSNNTYDTINGTNYKFDMYVDPSSSDFGLTTNCYSNVYNSSQVLRSSSDGYCLQVDLFKGTSPYQIGKTGGIYRSKDETGPFRVKESFYYASNTIKLTYYLYDKYFLVRLTTQDYTGDYKDGADTVFYVDDLDSGGEDSFGLHYATGSNGGQVNTWDKKTSTTYDTFDLGANYSWTSWYGSSSDNLTIGAVYSPLEYNMTDEESDIVDNEAIWGNTYDTISAGMNKTGSLVNADIALGVFHYAAGDSEAKTTSILEAYENPATPSCVEHCDYAAFDSKEFVYTVKPSGDLGKTLVKFKLIGNSAWTQNHKVYVKILDAHNVEVQKYISGSWTTIYTPNQVQQGNGYVIFSDEIAPSETAKYRIRRVGVDGIPSQVKPTIYPLPFKSVGDEIDLRTWVLDENDDPVTGATVDTNVTGPNTTNLSLSWEDSLVGYNGTFRTTDWAPGVFKADVQASKPISSDNTTQECSSFWGFDCGYGPPETGDNTFDDCPSGTGQDESVENIWINGTIFRPGDPVQVTCEFDTYDTAHDQEYIWYYNGTGWKKLWEGDVGNNVVANKTVTFTPDSVYGTQWVRCIIDYDPEGDYCANSGDYYDNDDLSFKVYPKILNISNTTYFHLYPGYGVSAYNMGWNGVNKTFLENKHIVGAISNDRNLVYEVFQKDRAESYSFNEISLPQIARVLVSSDLGLGDVNSLDATTGENLTSGQVNASLAVNEPKAKKVCFVCYNAGSPDSTYEVPYIQALKNLGYQVDYNVTGCNYSHTDIKDGTADFSGYDFWAHSWIYTDNQDLTNAKTKYVDDLGQSELILGPDTTYLGDFGYATKNDKTYYPSEHAYVVLNDGFLPAEDYKTGEIVKITDATSGKMQYESHEDSLISSVTPIFKIGGTDTIYVPSGVYKNATSGGKMAFFGIAEDAIGKIANYSDGTDNGEEVLTYLTEWVGGAKANMDMKIKLRDEDDDYLVFNLTNFPSDISEYEDLMAMFAGKLGSSYEDDRIHLENDSDWLISGLPSKTWVSTSGNYTAFYDNGTNDALTNITIGLVAYPSSKPANLYAWYENAEGGMLNYSTANLGNDDWLSFFFVYTLGNLSIDHWIETIEHGEYPIPNFMTLPGLEWNQSSLSLGPIPDGSSDSKNVTLNVTGWQTKINISAISGNATNESEYFITADPNYFTIDHGTNQINITCNPPKGQANGYYEVVFNARSHQNPEGANLTVGCQVGGLNWNQSSLDFGTVYQAHSSNSTVKLESSGDNTDVVIEMVSGNSSFIRPNATGFSSISSHEPILFECKPYPWIEPGNYTAVWRARSDQNPNGDNITVSCEVKRAKQIVVVYTDGTWDIFPFSLDSWLVSADDQASFSYSCGSSGTAYIHYYNITVDPTKLVDKIVFSDNSTELNQITSITMEKTPGTY